MFYNVCYIVTSLFPIPKHYFMSGMGNIRPARPLYAARRHLEKHQRLPRIKPRTFFFALPISAALILPVVYDITVNTIHPIIRPTNAKDFQSPPQADRHRKPTNAVAKRLGRQMGAARRKCTRVGPNCRDLAIGNWNVSSLTGKEQELVCEAHQYGLDVVGISSTKRRGSGAVELNGGWKIFYSGVDAAMSAQAGVGLLVSPNKAECVVDWVPLGGRVCLLKLRLQERSLCILQVYASSIESQYEGFLEEVEVALGKATSSESLVLLSDFNAHVGIDNATWKGVIGQHGDPDINKNGRCLL